MEVLSEDVPCEPLEDDELNWEEDELGQGLALCDMLLEMGGQQDTEHPGKASVSKPDYEMVVLSQGSSEPEKASSSKTLLRPQLNRSDLLVQKTLMAAASQERTNRVRKYFGEATEDDELALRQPPSKRPCKFFQIGTCSKGSTCPFLHDAGDRMDDEGGYVANKSSKLLRPKLTPKLTPKCRSAADTRSSPEDHAESLEQEQEEVLLDPTKDHLTDAIRQLQESILHESVGCQETTTRSKIQCKFFMAGTCTKGEACQFQHSTIPSAEAPGGDTSRVICKFFAEGRCGKGLACKYLHELPELPSVSSPSSRS